MQPAYRTRRAPGPALRAGDADRAESDLLPASWRRHLALVIGASAVWVSAWAVAVHGGDRPLAVERPLNAVLAGRPHLMHAATILADINRPPVFAGLMILMLGLCVGGRSVRAAATLAVALVVTLAVVEAGKVVVGRVNTMGMLTFPSGHVGVVSVLASVTILLARPCGPLGRRLPTAARVGLVAVALAAVVAVAAAMVVLQAHFVTDTIAAAPIGLSVTLAVAAVADSRARRGAPGR